MYSRDLYRKKALLDLWNGMSDEEKSLFVGQGISTELAQQRATLEQIRKSQSWSLDFASNIAGNAVFDTFVYLLSRVVKL